MACGCCVGMACRADALLGSRYGGKAMARRPFDIADVYGRGACEGLLGEAFAANPGLRDRVILQSKVGIRKEDDGFTWYDFSKEHIIEAVDASLSRWASTTSTRCCCKRAISMGRCRQLNAPSFAHVRTA